MESLPYELIYIIYNYLLHPSDIIRLASTCKQMRHNVPDEIMRVLDIRKRYIDINKSIRSIKYYIAEYNINLYSRSIRITDKFTVLLGTESFDNERHRSRMTIVKCYMAKKLIYGLHSGSIDDNRLAGSFGEYRNEIYQTLADRGIKREFQYWNSD